MQLRLDRHSSVPMYRQLAGELREQIVSGALAEGYRLPTERELAARMSVNRATILQAYQQLKDEGLIASKVGKGTFVLPVASARSASVPSAPQPPVPSDLVHDHSHPRVVTIRDTRRRDAAADPEPTVIRPPWSVLFSDYSNRFTYHDIAEAERAQRGGAGAADGHRIIDFATGSPNPADIPDDLLRAVSLEAFASREFDGQPESPIEGFDELRALLADHMRTRGVQCDVRNVMVLSGSEQGIDLIVRAFVNPGDCVFVEQSTFFPALQSFRSADARIVGIPMDAHGMRTDLLDGYCARFRPKLIYTIPTFHNPTGATMPVDRRRELIDVARRYQCLIIEDDAYGELWYGAADASLPAHRPVPLKGMENAGYVMYLSTFSKTVTSGLRTGWIVADPHVIARLAALRRMVDQHTSTSSQRICLELLREGRIAAHVRTLTAAYRTRRDAVTRALTRYAPDGMRWTVPAGGYYVWVTLPDGVRSLDVLAACRARGVTFMPGGVFDVDETDDAHLRLNVVRPDAADLERGVRVICETVAEIRDGLGGPATTRS
ncbi:GntR family transcriptional regulator [Bifidobacterium ramosum]|uniref:Aminotransferase class I/II-fold pyridoxal phosphate-dependent enzyme n=1 Tax=Bifidobacterium ramosum TaxID=1798158 RepID=A0A6L4X1Q6_9BIFI|nr:PLP-dependent aminotransferase family protein [Bifidobacterium ramosum]KAB8288965.1 GntR family transcriptional regulator [Bifidobacterium ramosum]NEG70682.1 aminotransferase class I/II-fold pyridoxal phosphate-dependent enzyme [Bifidobacterium ramosum]